MKILLVGDCGSVFLSQLAEQLRKNHITVSLFDLSKLSYEGFNGSFLVCKNDLLPKVILKIPKIRGLFKLYLVKKTFGRYSKLLCEHQIINFHFFNREERVLFDCFSNCSSPVHNKLIISIWGSDFYRANRRKRDLDAHCYQRASLISFTNEKTIGTFTNYYKNLHLEDRCRAAPFGLQPVDEIKLIGDRSVAGPYVDNVFIDPNKIKVVIGYNGSKGQQHLKIIDNFKKLPSNILDKIIFIIPLGYGGDKRYKKNIAKALAKTSMHYKILPNFLPYREVAKLRLNGDVMLNLQITDQFSGSMIESLFAGNVVITGSWLPYSSLADKGAYFEIIDNFFELNDKLVNVVENLAMFKEKCKVNPDAVAFFADWDINIKKWIDLYK